MNKKQCNALLPLVQLLPAVAAAAAVLFALPRTVPVLAAVPEKLTVSRTAILFSFFLTYIFLSLCIFPIILYEFAAYTAHQTRAKIYFCF